MPAQGDVGVVESPKDGCDRPESSMAEKSRRADHPPADRASTPRFLGHIGHVKTLGRGGGAGVRAKVDADGPRRSKEEATGREPWLRVGTPSDGDISHVTQVQLALFVVEIKFRAFNIYRKNMT